MAGKGDSSTGDKRDAGGAGGSRRAVSKRIARNEALLVLGAARGPRRAFHGLGCLQELQVSQ